MAKFLLLTHIYPPAIDGGSRVIAKMGEYLESQGHQILVVTSNCASTDDFALVRRSHFNIDDDGQNIIRLPVFTLLHRPFKLLAKFIPSFKTFSKGPIFKNLPLKKVIDYKPDYILAGPLPTTIVIYAKIFQFFTNSKLIINASFHQSDPEFSTPILQKILKSSDYIWTLTDFETEYFNKQLKIPNNKLINIGNGIDTSFLIKNKKNTPKNKINLLYVGSFAAHKNIETLILAFKLLPKKYTLTLAGQKTLYYPTIQKQLNILNKSISSRIKIIYSFPDKNLSKLIDSSKILISPSIQESFGLVIIEAMARKKPVIAANIPASVEILKKSQAGLIFESKNPIDLKNKIEKLINNQKLSVKMGDNGFNYVSKHYTWNKIGDNLCKKLDIY